MSIIAVALKHMLAAGMPHDAIVAAVEDMERAIFRPELASPETVSDIARIVLAFRKRHNLTQTHLAEKIDVGQSTIVRWEQGAEPRFKAWKRFHELAKEYGEEIPATLEALLA